MGRKRFYIPCRLFVRNPVPLPGYIPRGASPAARRVLAEVYAHELAEVGHPGRMGRVALVVVWAVVMARECVLKYRRQRPAIRRELPEVGDVVHLRRLFACAFFHNIAPDEFYRYKLYLDRFYRRRGEYMLFWQLIPMLLRAVPPDGADRLRDKHVFWRAATAAGLPTVPVWGFLRAGGWVEGSWDELVATGRDLVVKPTALGQGKGIDFLDRRGEGWEMAGRRLSMAEARAWIEARSREHDRIIQPRIHNHPALARYGVDGLITLRLLTMRSRRADEPVLLAAALRMPHGKGRLANLHQDALVARIDLDTGRLGPAAGVAPANEDLAVHPVSGVPIEGEVVPHWMECKRICVAGHRMAPTLNSIGWDVVIDAEGPKLLEVNVTWGPHVLQIAGGEPLWATRFPELYERTG